MSRYLLAVVFCASLFFEASCTQAETSTRSVPHSKCLIVTEIGSRLTDFEERLKGLFPGAETVSVDQALEIKTSYGYTMLFIRKVPRFGGGVITTFARPDIQDRHKGDSEILKLVSEYIAVKECPSTYKTFGHVTYSDN